MWQIPSLSPQEQRIVAELSAHPAWPVLRKIEKQRMDLKFEGHAKALMAGMEFDQRQVDYDRGYFAGMKHLLDTPERERAALQREEVNASA